MSLVDLFFKSTAVKYFTIFRKQMQWSFLLNLQTNSVTYDMPTYRGMIKGTLMQIWKSTIIFIVMRKWYVTWKHHLLFEMGTWDKWKVCLQTFRNNKVC